MIELIIAFGAGLISFLSPCVLPLIPGYISYISGSSIDELVDKLFQAITNATAQLEAEGLWSK